jgi:hypothetical protein
VLDWTASGKGEGEHRLQQDFLDWLADGHTLSEKITLIFSTGFGEYNEEKNLNPIVWPVLMDLADAVHDGTANVFAIKLCDSWGTTFNTDGRIKDQIELLHHIFDYLANYLQMFATYADEESLCPEFSPDLDFDHWWTEINQRIAERYYG